MAYPIPKATDAVLKQGDTGIAVWALQRVCNGMAIPTKEDGDFGSATKQSATLLQTKLGVGADGEVGPQTQRGDGRTKFGLAGYLAGRQERVEDLPSRLLLSKTMYESGGYLSAVNWTSPGGVDVGMLQRRVYERDFKNEVTIKWAFDPIAQFLSSAASVQSLYRIFLARGAIKKIETAYRCAILNWNYPALADKISRVGFTGLEGTSYTRTQSWVTSHNLKFPDGHPIKTPLEWGQRYALGNKDHNEPGQAVKLVTSWT